MKEGVLVVAQWVGRGRGGLILKKRGMDVKQSWRMVHDRSVGRGMVRGNAWAVAWGRNH